MGRLSIRADGIERQQGREEISLSVFRECIYVSVSHCAIYTPILPNIKVYLTYAGAYVGNCDCVMGI